MSKLVNAKKAPALSKLSRSKKTDTFKHKTSRKDLLNESDDFVESSNKNKKVSKQNIDRICIESVCPTESSTILASSASFDNLPKCRFCGKSFPIGQELKWTSHLKSCGSSLGVPAEKLIEVKRLTEKQANEWKELGLPDTTITNSPCCSRPTTNTAVQAEKSKTTNRTRSKAQASTDPGLEIALALSASLAQANQIAEEQFLSEIGESKTSPSKTIKNTVPAVLLAQATVLPKGKGRNGAKNPLIKTTLQTRSEVERMRQISEVAETILTSGLVDAPTSSHEGRFFQLRSSPQSEALNKWRLKQRPLWKAAELKNFQKNYVDAMKAYKELLPISVKRPEKEVNKNQNKVKVDKEKLENLLSHDWSVVLESGDLSDLTIFSKDETPFPCHALVLHARCKAILNEIIEEEDKLLGVRKIISWDDISKSAAQIFIKYLYMGKLPDHLTCKSEWVDLTKLANRYNVKSVKDFVKQFEASQFEDDDDDLVNLTASNGGFVEVPNQQTTQDEIKRLTSATQNMDLLLDAFSLDVTLGQKEKGVDDLDESDDWNEMCQFLTQKRVSCNKSTGSSSSVIQQKSHCISAEGNDDAFKSPISSHTVADLEYQRSAVAKPTASKSQSSEEWDRLWSSENPSENKPVNNNVQNSVTNLNNSESEQVKSDQNKLTNHETSCESKCTSEVDIFSSPLQLEVTPPGGKDVKSDGHLNSEPAKHITFKRELSIAGEEDLYSDEDQVDEVIELANVDKVKKFTSPKKFDSVQSPKKTGSKETEDPSFPSPDGKIPSHSRYVKSYSPAKINFSISKDLNASDDENYDFEMKLNRAANRSESPDLFADDSLVNADHDSLHNVNDSLHNADDNLVDADESDQENLPYVDDCLADANELVGAYEPDAIVFGEDVCSSQIQSRKRRSDFELSTSKRSRLSSLPYERSRLTPGQRSNFSSSPFELPTPNKSDSSPASRSYFGDKSLLSNSAKKRLSDVFEEVVDIDNDVIDVDNDVVECGIDDFRTPPKPVRSLSMPCPSTSGTCLMKTLFTPKPDYEAMLTPALRRELRRFGLKAIPRRKAVPLLSHIYQETHPGVKQRSLVFNASQDVDADPEPELSESLSQESEDVAEDLMEETMLNDQLLLQEPCTDGESLAKTLMQFLSKDEDLYRACLTYEPIWLEDIFARFKTETGFKCTLSHFTDILDNECITFRTRARQKGRNNSPKKRGKSSPKKKTSSSTSSPKKRAKASPKKKTQNSPKKKSSPKKKTKALNLKDPIT